MENIQFRRKNNQGKRNIESIIEQSAIDIENYEIFQIRKAFNQSIQRLTDQNLRLTNQLDKIKNILRKQEEVKRNYQLQIEQLRKEVQIINQENIDLIKRQESLKKVLQTLQFKYQVIQTNRQAALKHKPHQIIDNTKEIVNKCYEQITLTISSKVKKISEELKKYSMSAELQWKIEGFFQQLIYMHPSSQIQNYKKNRKNVGKITTKHQGSPQQKDKNITNDKNIEKDKIEWKKYQISLERLRNIEKSRSPLRQIASKKHQNDESNIEMNRSKSRKRIFQNNNRIF